MRSVFGVLVLAMACQRTVASVEPADPDAAARDGVDAPSVADAGPVDAGASAGAVADADTADADTSADADVSASSAADTDAMADADLDPPPTWEWALSVAPALAHHTEQSDSTAVFERFARWFAEGPRRFYVRLGDECFKARGSVDDGFRFRETVTTEGNTRTVSSYGLLIGQHGITETGPGGTTYERDAKGRWKEVGGYGTGCADEVVQGSMSKVERGVVYFDDYTYTLTAECSHEHQEQQACEDGSTRTCSRCTGIWLQPHARNRGWGRGRMASRAQRHPPPVFDCTQPCPADEVTPKLAPLNQVLKGRRFHGTDGDDEGVLFLRGKECRQAAKRERARWDAAQ